MWVTASAYAWGSGRCRRFRHGPDRNSGLFRHYRVPLDCVVDGPLADPPHVRDDLFLLPWVSRRGGAARPHRKTRPAVLTDSFVLNKPAVDAARYWIPPNPAAGLLRSEVASRRPIVPWDASLPLQQGQPQPNSPTCNPRAEQDWGYPAVAAATFSADCRRFPLTDRQPRSRIRLR